MMLGIPLRRPDASPVFCSALVEGLAKHILYMHQQIPCSYDELQRSVAPPPPEVDDEGEPVSRVRRPSMASRKAAKLVHALDELFAMLPGALALARVPLDAGGPAGPSAAGSTVAALMLGSSPAAPRIVILLRIFPLAAGIAGPSSAAEAAAAVRDGKLRVLRAVTIQCGQLAAVNPGLCRLHLLVQAPPDAPLPASAFQPRPGLTLKLKRAHTICVGVGGPASGCAIEPHEPPLRAQDWCAARVVQSSSTLCRPGCNPLPPGLQPVDVQAATRIPGCNPRLPQAATGCNPTSPWPSPLQPRASQVRRADRRPGAAATPRASEEAGRADGDGGQANPSPNPNPNPNPNPDPIPNPNPNLNPNPNPNPNPQP